MSIPSCVVALDAKACEQARLTRDARFDGLFFTAVRTTGIYCRPVCPAPTAHARNVEYFPNAAAAAGAGYRPCLRCRPEAAPGTPLTCARSGLVAAALRMIDAGALDEGSVAQLAGRIGVGERHLRRLFVDDLGAGPLEIAATRRLLFAKKLLTETNLPVTRIAHAAGYASLRRFNSAFLAGYGRAPRDLRRDESGTSASSALSLRIPFRAPYDFHALLAFFARRAIAGLERVEARGYTRRFALDGKAGTLRVSKMRAADTLALDVDFADTSRLQTICARVRRLFDVDADIAAIDAQLARDPRLRAFVRRHPGQRLPGGWDGFEIAVRAVLGQQISVAAARTLAARLLDRFGEPATLPNGENFRLFPAPEVLADADLTQIGLPRTRAATLNTIACAVADGVVDFRPEQSLDGFVASWCELPGIGAWTAHYMAMRAMSHPDAFPAADLVLRKMLGAGGTLPSARAVEALAEHWRPWRAYAVMHLWRNSI
ncbi:MAG: DNA-3-methyladenine glycosylase 2 family protein [Xanthomonadaceae bacterium]|nr:DNA-3-methyladenine glycosylase 2 family protein [Xanthomonadaceae bacterium]MDE2084971.1 DNA-3-methyladenine glycosylase 2 family protein [Xanthomonadaceae bacterium]